MKPLSCNIKNIIIFATINFEVMTFDKILENGRLWAVRYDKDNVNALERVLSQWSDAEWLAGFSCRMSMI